MVMPCVFHIVIHIVCYYDDSDINATREEG